MLYKNNLFFFYLVLFFLFITNCSNKNQDLIKKPEKILPLESLYKQAFLLYENGKLDDSVNLFKKVETRYSYSDWAPRATLMVMFIYFESGEQYKTLEYAKKFKKLYPSSKNLDYVEYISALTFYENINVTSKDQTYTEEALKLFKNIRKKYPNSKYAEDALYKLDLVNEQLAGKEMYLARYYMNKSKWIAAIKRLNNIIKFYDKTVYSEEALHRLVEIYYKLGNLKEAKKYAAILGYNFNSGEWYKKSYKITVDKNFYIEKKKEKRKLKERIKKLFKFSK